MLVLGEWERWTERVAEVQALGSNTKLEETSMRHCETAVGSHATPSPCRWYLFTLLALWGRPKWFSVSILISLFLRLIDSLMQRSCYLWSWIGLGYFCCFMLYVCFICLDVPWKKGRPSILWNVVYINNHSYLCTLLHLIYHFRTPSSWKSVLCSANVAQWKSQTGEALS